MVLFVVLCVLLCMGVAPAASAASYSKVYGRTQDKVRVREQATPYATIIDNIVKDACVYVTSSKESGGRTYIQVRYRASDGTVATGWVCQNDGSTTYVKILSQTEAKNQFSVSGGDVPSERVGTFSTAQRHEDLDDTSNSYIRPGSSGAAVRDLQTKLKALGYYSGSITGNVGEKTEAAVKAFQSRNGLSADGIAGPDTLAKINAAYVAAGSPKVPDSNPSEPSSDASDSSKSEGAIKLNSQGSDVRQLQKDLTTLGYYSGTISGKVGAKTEAAIKEFQRKNGLEVDGVAGADTLAAIARALKGSGSGSSGSSSSNSSSSGPIKLNSTGSAVEKLQRDLKTLGYYNAEITGKVGAKTEAAIKAFQRKNGLTVDGVAGADTLAAIAAKLSGSSSGSSGTSSGAPGLHIDSTGSEVRALQEDLTTLGYYYADITGHYGNQTKVAVQKFQKDHGLTQDGVAGADTLAAIKSALKNSGSVASGSSGSALREGDSGSAVTELQTMLKQLNIYYGEITGNFGTLTRQAVRKFQSDYGLRVDGVAGAETINKLRSLTSGTSTGGGTSTTVDVANSFGRITKNNVYLRSSYSITSTAKTSLSTGTLVRITQIVTTSDARWYYITVRIGKYTYNGYVRSDMMETISEAEYNSAGGDSNQNTADMETLGMIRVTSDNVRLRYEPSTSAQIVGYANKGDIFYYVDTTAGWFRTRSGYWISSIYAEVLSGSEADQFTNNGSSGKTSYRYDDTGSMVSSIQEMLYVLGYYKNEITGHFGAKTEEAVKKFQRDQGLSADGVVGEQTLARLRAEYAALSGSAGNPGTGTYGSVVYNINWFGADGKINSCYSSVGLTTRGTKATLTDLRTGSMFNITVQSAGNHCDVEPSTSSDTAVLCSLYGVTRASDISWRRRPMLITVNGYQFVCSIYATPHGNETITNNNFPGQFCVHFLGSTIHSGDGGYVPDGENHQDIIQEGLQILRGMTVNGQSVQIKSTFP